MEQHLGEVGNPKREVALQSSEESVLIGGEGVGSGLVC